MTHVRPEAVAPRVTIVIAALNEARFIGATVEALVNQQYEGSIEILVADGGSTDGTAGIVTAFTMESTPSRNVRLISNPSGHAAGGFQAGFDAARSQYVMICGGRTLLEPTHVATAVRLFASSGADEVGVVGGGVRRFIAVDDSAFARAAALLYESPVGAGVAEYHRRKTAGFVDTVYCGLYRTDIVRQVGGMDSAYERGQDADLNARIRAAGVRILFHPDLSSTYRFNISLFGVVRRGLTTGEMAARGWLRGGSALAPRHLAPVSLLIGSIVGGAVAIGVPLARLPLAGAALLYLGALAAEGLRLAGRQPTVACAVPVVFGAYHYSYGIGEVRGFLRGLIERLDR